MADTLVIEIMKARRKFCDDYSLARGWAPDLCNLTTAQIIEIRNQPGWQIPCICPVPIVGADLPIHVPECPQWSDR